jgi:predicted MFS family arabinose efflux permease
LADETITYPVRNSGDTRGGLNPALAPFAVRSFRFQWPADLCTSLAFEADMLILGWYVLATTGSVEQLVAFGAIIWIGSIFSPFLGMAGDRIGLRALLCLTRGIYAALAAALTVLTLSATLEPWHVFVIMGIAGLLRPSDQAIRNLLVGHTMRPDMLMGALGISRTTADMAKVAGALLGAAGVAMIGMGPAYVIVTALYVVSFVLSLKVARSPILATRTTARDVIAGLVDGVRYVWSRQDLLGAFLIAFLVNALAFPFVLGLLPYAAREVYAIGQAGLGWLALAFAIGALAGSLVVGSARVPIHPGRVMLASTAIWFVAIAVFGFTRSLPLGLALLFVMGFAQSFCLLPVAAIMIRGAREEMRARVMAMRIVAIWGLPIGLLAAGPVIDHMGYAACALLYATAGLAATLAIGYRWRAALWQP